MRREEGKEGKREGREEGRGERKEREKKKKRKRRKEQTRQDRGTGQEGKGREEPTRDTVFLEGELHGLADSLLYLQYLGQAWHRRGSSISLLTE